MDPEQSVLLAAEHAWHWDIFAAVALLGVKGQQDFITDKQGMCLKTAIKGASQGANKQREQLQDFKRGANIQELNIVSK